MLNLQILGGNNQTKGLPDLRNSGLLGGRYNSDQKPFCLVKAVPDDFTVICSTGLQNAAKTLGDGNEHFLAVSHPSCLYSTVRSSGSYSFRTRKSVNRTNGVLSIVAGSVINFTDSDQPAHLCQAG